MNYATIFQNEELTNYIKKYLTTTDYNKERLLLISLLNPIAINIVIKQLNNTPVTNVAEIGLKLGYEIKELTIIRSDAESIGLLLKDLVDYNYNYIYNNLNQNSSVLGISSYLPNSLQTDIIKYEEEMKSMNYKSKIALHNLLGIELNNNAGGI